MGHPRPGYKQVTLYMPETTYRTLKVAAAQNDLTLSNYVLALLGGKTVVVKGDFVPAPQPGGNPKRASG